MPDDFFKFDTNLIDDTAKQSLPASSASMVVGIFGLLCALFMPLIGIVLSIVALTLGNKAIREAKSNENRYKPGDKSQAQSGKVLGIVGLCLSTISLIVIFFLFWIFGIAFGFFAKILDAIVHAT